ncbi:hypothetical protein JW710_04045 [Candidatus Dojkabacteria bacterium]|nr:hypothetical protein [Candidatus Dojkabacteria bacterium]
MADEVLPFLVGRKIAIEQKFDDVVMYHRHPKSQKERWIYIDEVEEVVDWADKHAWSFHPHIEGRKDWWFVIDIDGRGESLNIELVGKVTGVMCEVFDDLGLEYLLKYSGNRGFHFMWAWDMSGVSLKGKNRWDEGKRLVCKYRDLLEERLQDNAIVAGKLRKAVGTSCPFTLTNSQDTRCNNSVLIDANILHENGNIRSPFSVHPKTGLVSIPIKGRPGLEDFSKDQAERNNVVKGDWSWVSMPQNKWK